MAIEQTVEEVADAMSENPIMWAELYLDLKEQSEGSALDAEKAAQDMAFLCFAPVGGEC